MKYGVKPSLVAKTLLETSVLGPSKPKIQSTTTPPQPVPQIQQSQTQVQTRIQDQQTMSLDQKNSKILSQTSTLFASPSKTDHIPGGSDYVAEATFQITVLAKTSQDLLKKKINEENPNQTKTPAPLYLPRTHFCDSVSGDDEY